MYYLLYGFLYLLSLLPFWILYRISDLAYIIIYYVTGYRKNVVLSNLSIAFPEKSLEEKKSISKKFYRNLTDNFIETIKLFSLSDKQLQKRFIAEFKALNQYYETGRNLQFNMGHFFNWEYANLAWGLSSKFTMLAVYMPVVNKAIDKIFYDLRTRVNTKLIAATNFLHDFKPYAKQRFSIVFIGDQSAGNVDTAYWLPFFGKITPFVSGPEKSARLNNTITLYAKFIKIKRGYYSVKFYLMSDEPRKLKEGQLTKQMVKHIEENIKEQPENYLWTHRRWKRKFDPAKHKAF